MAKREPKKDEDTQGAAAASAAATQDGGEQGGDQAQTAPKTTAPAEPPAPAPRPSAAAQPDIVTERNDNRTPAARALLLHVCELFGVDPTREAEELLGWTFYPANAITRTPAAVRIVTAAGQKFKVFEDDTLDDDTTERLARIFGVEKKDGGYDLPEDVTLPRPMVVHVASTDHHYKRGYLRSGGKTEAARRQALKKKKG